MFSLGCSTHAWWHVLLPQLIYHGSSFKNQWYLVDVCILDNPGFHLGASPPVLLHTLLIPKPCLLPSSRHRQTAPNSLLPGILIRHQFLKSPLHHEFVHKVPLLPGSSQITTGLAFHSAIFKQSLLHSIAQALILRDGFPIVYKMEEFGPNV